MRHIEKTLFEYIDHKLKENGMAQEAIKNKDARLLFIEAAKSCVGIREEGGNNKGPLVELIQKTIGDANREAWCMAFQQSMLAYVETKIGIYSRLFASEHCLTVWAKSSEDCRVKYFPLPGAIVIWRHGQTTNGHTGVFLEADGDQMLCVEGNSNRGLDADGTIIADGGGVYLTKRSMKKNGDMTVTGYLKPF